MKNKIEAAAALLIAVSLCALAAAASGMWEPEPPPPRYPLDERTLGALLDEETKVYYENGMKMVQTTRVYEKIGRQDPPLGYWEMCDPFYYH